MSHHPSTWQQGDLIANGIKLHYTFTGVNKPPIVLAHGITDNGLCWSRLAQALQSDYDLIMVDARGHGLSEVPDTGYSERDHAADLAGVIQSLGLQKPALLGHSMGATSVATLAAFYPNLASCILLEDPPWRTAGYISPPDERRSRAEEWESEVRERKSKSAEAIRSEGHRTRPRWPDVEFESWVTAKQQVSPNAIQYVRIGITPWDHYIQQITCPSLLITGDTALDAVVSEETAAQIEAANQNFRVAHIPNAGHSIRREQFDAYIQAARIFLKDVYLQ